MKNANVERTGNGPEVRAGGYSPILHSLAGARGALPSWGERVRPNVRGNCRAGVDGSVR